MMSRIDPRMAPRIKNSPVQRIISILDELFSSAPQPRVRSEAARRCGELLGRHLLNLMGACGELNLMGFHSAAISLFRPMEDALDCLAAVTIIAGGAGLWETGKLRPSNAAKLWHRRFEMRHRETGEIVLDYRKKLRSIYNNFAHCAPLLAYWDLFLQDCMDDNRICELKVNHENLIIESNAYRIDAYLVAHCSESLHVIEVAYADYFELHPKIKEELKSLEVETGHILEGGLKAGLFNDIVPVEMEGLTYKQVKDRDFMQVKGKWKGCWTCTGGGEVKNAKLSLQQEERIVRGSLTLKVPTEDGVVTIIEDISGVIEEAKLLMDGTCSEVRQDTAKYKYRLDTFELRYLSKEKRLEGMHSCNLGKGDAVFERI